MLEDKLLLLCTQGEGGVRDIVEGIPTRTKEKPYLACLMGLDSTSNVQHARWVVGGKLDVGIGFVATNLFPLAEKGLYLELHVFPTLRKDSETM